MTHRHFTAVASLASLLAACSYTPPVLEPFPVSIHGTYRFTDRVTEASPPLVVEGEFTIQADTILVGLVGQGGVCQPYLPAQLQAISFRCGTVGLSFDRQNPLQRAGYSIQGTAMVTQRVCRRFGTAPNGTQVCLEYGQERVQVERTFSGLIRPIPVR